MNLTIAEAESLLKTQYNVFEHSETSKRSLAVDEYSVPEHVRRHIDYISPTVQPLTMIKHIIQKEAEVDSINVAGSGLPDWVWDLSSCDTNTTRACIQALYNMPNGTYQHAPLAVVEYQTEAYIKNDLDLYMQNFVSEDCDEEPTILVMSDTTFNTTAKPDIGEGNLDVQLGYGLSKFLTCSVSDSVY
jgi:tripeptidyl-peptidase-1